MQEATLIYLVGAGLVLGFAVVLATFAFLHLRREVAALREHQDELAEVKHREVLTGLHEGLMDQGERVTRGANESSERLRLALQTLQLSQQGELSSQRESLHRALGELATGLKSALALQAHADQEAIQSSLHRTSQQLIESVAALTRGVDSRLDQISGRVS